MSGCPQCGGRGTEDHGWDPTEACAGCGGAGVSGRDANQPAKATLGGGATQHPATKAAERDANQLAADVRAGLNAMGEPGLDFPAKLQDDAWDALDELVGLVGTLQQERDEARVDFDIAHQEYVEEATAHGATRERAEAAEAALADLRALFDGTLANGEEYVREKFEALAEAHRNDRAALAEARQALTEIGNANVFHAKAIARRALTDTGGDTA